MEQFKLSVERSGNISFGCLLDDREKLVSSAFGSAPRAVRRHLVEYSKNLGADVVPAESSLTHQMIDLFDGKKYSRRVVYNTEHISDFQRDVYRILEQIPIGKVTTYGLISQHLKSAPRAVGGAVASNPWPLFIPCERVVNFNLTVGNYGLCGSLGPEGTVTKRTLLEREGVHFVQDRVDRASLWDPSRNNH